MCEFDSNTKTHILLRGSQKVATLLHIMKITECLSSALYCQAKQITNINMSALCTTLKTSIQSG